MKDKPLTRHQIAEAEQRIRDYKENGKPLFRTCMVYESSKNEPGILVDRTGKTYHRDSRGTLRRVK